MLNEERWGAWGGYRRLRRVYTHSVEDGLRAYEEGGYDGVVCDISVARACAHVPALSIENATARKMARLGPLDRVSHLRVEGPNGAGLALDLEAFPHLESFGTPGHAGLRFPHLPWLQGLFLGSYVRSPDPIHQLPTVLPALEVLQFGTGHRADLPTMPEAPKLRHLVYHFGRSRSLEHFAGYDRLEVLDVRQNPDLTDLATVERFRALREATFQDCRRLEDFTPLGACRELEKLGIANCRAVTTLRFLEACPALREAHILTKVVDGDLTPLIGVASLNVRHMRHYSHREEELMSLTAAGVSRSELPPRGPDLRGTEDPMRIDIDADENIVSQWTSRVPDLVAAARRRLADDPGEDGLMYAEHHLAELDPEAWEATLGLDHAPSVPELLALLEPVALWGDPTDGLHLDFSVGEDLTQYVLSFEVHPDGTLGGHTMES